MNAFILDRNTVLIFLSLYVKYLLILNTSGLLVFVACMLLKVEGRSIQTGHYFIYCLAKLQITVRVYISGNTT